MKIGEICNRDVITVSKDASILEVQPDALHQRIPLMFGAADEIERLEAYHRDHNEREYNAPLFGARGLFRAAG